MAVTYAQQNKGAESVKWLKMAVLKGFNNWEAIETDGQFDPIRKTSDYKKFIVNHTSRNMRTTQ